MSKIESRTGTILQNDERIYSFISDLSNLSSLIPLDKVEDWHADADQCSFSIAGIGKAGLRIIERDPFKLVKIISDETTPMRLTMWIQLKNCGENDTKVKISMEPEGNSVMMMMVKQALKKFMDKLITEMEKFRF